MGFLRNLLGLEKPQDANTPSTVTVAPTTTSTKAKVKFNVGWFTDVGQVRRHNEDAVQVFISAHDGNDVQPPFGLFILADGMGGHQAGEIASSLASRAVTHYIIEALYLPNLINSKYDDGKPALNEILVAAIQAANDAVIEKAPGAGTTLTCALMLGSRAYIAHVGDSRAYVATEEGLHQITHDHSLVDRLVEMGQLTQDEATIHPQKNVLYRAVGQDGKLDVDTYAHTIPEDGHLLICSDGLWGMMTEDEMSKIVTTSPTPQSACEALVAAANQAGGHDNISVILVASPPDWMV